MTSHLMADSDFSVVFGRTRIEFDQNKEMINRSNHHYSLGSAAHLLERLVLPIQSPPFLTSDVFWRNGEMRYNHMTEVDGFVVFFVTTVRSDNVIRVISLRQASSREAALYRASFADQSVL